MGTDQYNYIPILDTGCCTSCMVVVELKVGGYSGNDQLHI